jgi:hypothetical protein
MVMAFCKSCGAALKPEAKFCSRCGEGAKKIAGKRDGTSNRFRQYGPIGGLTLFGLIGGVTFLSFHMDSKSAETGPDTSSGADGGRNVQSAVIEDERAAPEISKSKFELILKEPKGVIFVHSDQKRGYLAEKLYSEAKDHCFENFDFNSKMDYSCIVLYLSPGKSIKFRNLKEFYEKYPAIWSGPTVVAFYSFDPDTSSERRRPDDLLIVDCNFFSKDPEINWIPCKFSPEDPISYDIARDKRMDAERKKSVEIMAADAQAAGDAVSD